METPGQIFVEIGGLLQWAGIIFAPLLLLPLAVLILPGLLGRLAAALAALIDWLTGLTLGGAMILALMMITAQLAVVLMRFVFGLSFSWLSESVTYTFAAVFMLAAAATLRDDGHVRVDILRPRFSPRARAIIEIAGSYLFIFPIMILILSAVIPSLTRSWAGLEGSRESDGLPFLFLFKTLVPAFAFLLLIQGLSQALKAALGLRGLARLEENIHSEIGPV